MTNSRRPERSAAGAHAASAGVPDRVALDQRFARGELYALRAAVAAHAGALGSGTEQVENLVIVASELATNAITHGGGTGRLRLWDLDGAVSLQVSDAGEGFADPEQAGLHRQDPAAPGGRGLWLARQLCDDVDIRVGPAGTVVTVTVQIAADADAEAERAC